MKNNVSDTTNSSIQLLNEFFRKQKVTYTRAEASEKLGRFLTFRELQTLHKKHAISDAELGLYMDLKGSSIITEFQLDALKQFHTKFK